MTKMAPWATAECGSGSASLLLAGACTWATNVLCYQRHKPAVPCSLLSSTILPDGNTSRLFTFALHFLLLQRYWGLEFLAAVACSLRCFLVCCCPKLNPACQRQYLLHADIDGSALWKLCVAYDTAAAALSVKHQFAHRAGPLLLVACNAMYQLLE
eukprot:GHRR01015197.1.p1 GENE.GHRR01015197.1~~GHRR01015197.1.p1  ORF type:complete len:156 (+),score=20.72 GHRR01015197.1:1394-1861(+)